MDDYPEALGCLGASLQTLRVDGDGQSKFSLQKYTLDSYLRLVCAALTALNVFPQNQEMTAGAAGSLFGLLNQTKTQLGARLLKKWLK